MRGLKRFGVKVTVADLTNLDAAASAIAQSAPKLVFFESPANPNLRIIDIAAISEMAHEAGGLGRVPRRILAMTRPNLRTHRRIELIANRQSALSQEILDIPVAQGEPEILIST